MGLSLGLRVGDSVLIEGDIRVTLIDRPGGGQAELDIEAPRHLKITRRYLTPEEREEFIARKRKGARCHFSH